VSIPALTYCILPQATSFIGDGDRHEDVEIVEQQFFIRVEMLQGYGVAVDRVPERSCILVTDMERYRQQAGYTHSIVFVNHTEMTQLICTTRRVPNGTTAASNIVLAMGSDGPPRSVVS
jgi:hypothetical protein